MDGNYHVVKSIRDSVVFAVHNVATDAPFSRLDDQPASMISLIVGALESMAANPEIQRVRRVAWDALSPAPGRHLLEVGEPLGAPGEGRQPAQDRRRVAVARHGRRGHPGVDGHDSIVARPPDSSCAAGVGMV